jgi:glycerophosphoryl diester phosphodiesterase
MLGNEPAVLNAGRTAIAAHRGGAGLWPENSRLAFRNSSRMGVDFVEFDVHRTADGHLVVHHDPELGRTSEGAGQIAEMNWQDLRRIRLRGLEDECVPDLAEVLSILGRSPVQLRLEIKQQRSGRPYKGIEAEILGVLRDAGLLDRTTITSFNSVCLETVRRDHGHDRLILLVRSEDHDARGRDVDHLCRIATSAGVPEIAIRASQLGSDDRERCLAYGLRLGAFAVNDEAAIEQALRAGMCAFTSDRPDLALAARAQLLGEVPA